MLKYYITSLENGTKEITSQEYVEYMENEAYEDWEPKTTAWSIVTKNRQNAREEGSDCWVMHNGNILTIKATCTTDGIKVDGEYYLKEFKNKSYAGRVFNLVGTVLVFQVLEDTILRFWSKGSGHVFDEKELELVNKAMKVLKKVVK